MSKEQENDYKIGQVNEFRVYLPTEQDLDYAQIVSEWIIGYGNMLSKTTEQILEYFKNGNSVLIMNETNVLVSHAAITTIYNDNSIEIGSVATNLSFQRKGAATIAVEQVVKLAKYKYPEGIVFALANKHSSKLFEKMEAPTMLSTELSEDVWTFCKQCPNYKIPLGGDIFRCCDTPYNLSDITI